MGIVGLPNVGKSTLFKALTKRQVDIADYPFTTINPNVGVVTVPDKRLEKIAEVVKPDKVTPTIIEFTDIAGLVKGAHKGEGLGNQFLAQIRNCDAILEVVRAFGENQNPTEDIEAIGMELEMKDLESKEEENLLSKKPILYLINGDDEQHALTGKAHLIMNLKLEEEIADLSKEEMKELGADPKIDQLIAACYNMLDLITFYTVTGGKEARAWTLKKGARAPEAGGKVHNDFQENFIKAEVISWNDLVDAESWVRAREKGLIKTAGKDYEVRDGDIIEFKI